MPSYHLSIKTISRSTGRSAVAAAAYRAGARIVDERTGLVHDYRRKGGVDHTQIVLPPGAADRLADRAALWNAAEAAERRRNSVTAREFEIALPGELPAADRRELALAFAGEIAMRHQAAVDVAIHAPGREGDQRNHHAHLLLTTRRIDGDGLGEKTRELDDQRSGEIGRWRERWADMQNERMSARGLAGRVDHRSLADQGLDREAQVHLGPKAAAMDRRGVQSERGRMATERQSARHRDEARIVEREGMDRRDLAREFRAKEPAAAPAYLAARDKSVRALARERDRAARGDQEARRRLGGARAAEAAWREQHKMRAFMQDLVGVGGRGVTRETDRREREAVGAARRFKVATREWERTAKAVERGYREAQAAPRARAEALRQELQIRWLESQRDRALERAQDRDRSSGLEP